MPATIDTENGEASDSRKLRESGNSVVVTLPPEILETAGLETGDTVQVAAAFEGGKITVKDADTDDE